MGIFDDDTIETAHGTAGGQYLGPGTHLLEIQRCKEGVSFAKKKFFVAELIVIESDNPTHKPGTPRSFMVTFDKYPDLSLGNVADFLRNALAGKLLKDSGGTADVKPEQIELKKALAQDCVGEKNPLVGVQIRCYAWDKLKKGKKPKSDGTCDPEDVYTSCKWYKLNHRIGEADKKIAA